MGIAIAALLQYMPEQGKRVLRYGNMLLLLGCMILAGAYFLCFEEQSFTASIFGFPVVSIGYGVLVLGALSPGSLVYNYRSGVTSTIASLSYGVYLIHKFIIHITQEQLAKLDVDRKGNLMFIICVLIVLTAAWLLHKLVERPCMNIRDRVLRH